MAFPRGVVQWGFCTGLCVLMLAGGCANQFDVEELEFDSNVRAQCFDDCVFIANSCLDEIAMRCTAETVEGFTPDDCGTFCGPEDTARLLVSISATRNCGDIANQFALIDEEACEGAPPNNGPPPPNNNPNNVPNNLPNNNPNNDGPTCEQNEDCGEGLICIGGECFLDDAPNNDPNNDNPVCQMDTDCGPNQRCSEGECRPDDGPNNDPVPLPSSCQQRSDCGPTEDCISNVCVTNCLQSDDCNEMPVCNDNGDFCMRPVDACVAACSRVIDTCLVEVDELCDDSYTTYPEDCIALCTTPGPGAMNVADVFFSDDCFETAYISLNFIPPAQDQCTL